MMWSCFSLSPHALTTALTTASLVPGASSLSNALRARFPTLSCVQSSDDTTDRALQIVASKVETFDSCLALEGRKKRRGVCAKVHTARATGMSRVARRTAPRRGDTRWVGVGTVSRRVSEVGDAAADGIGTGVRAVSEFSERATGR
ncbi:hypothetical protein C8Q77DRAFT_1109635 [Trametes polyzona]|nr:hypothetical protein C8Q77DRAFT_1109635 [Trametes polyzona]